MDDTLRLWDAASGECLAAADRAHRRVISADAWSPDGRWLASVVAADDTLRLWDAASGDMPGGC